MSNIDKHRRAHEAFNRRDWAGVVQDFTADTEYTDQASGMTLKGPQAFVDYLRDNWVAAFSDVTVTEVSYLDAGDYVVGQFIGSGINDGALGPLPATGRPMETPFCEIMQFNSSGQIISGSLYYSQLTMLVQLGHMEAPPTA